MRFDSQGVPENGDEEILSKGFDKSTGIEVVLISCPPSALGGEDGPVFEHIDKKTVYVLINEDLVDNVIESAPNKYMGAVQYGMLLGDVMRRGMYYAQNLNKTPKKRRNENE